VVRLRFRRAIRPAHSGATGGLVAADREPLAVEPGPCSRVTDRPLPAMSGIPRPCLRRDGRLDRQRGCHAGRGQCSLDPPSVRVIGPIVPHDRPAGRLRRSAAWPPHASTFRIPTPGRGIPTSPAMPTRSPATRSGRRASGSRSRHQRRGAAVGGPDPLLNEGRPRTSGSCSRCSMPIRTRCGTSPRATTGVRGDPRRLERVHRAGDADGSALASLAK